MTISDTLPLGRIGGHIGMDVIRESRPDGTTVIKKMARHDEGNQSDLVGVDLYGLNEAAIHNEAVMLDLMTDSGFAPHLLDIEVANGTIWEDDVGVSEAPQNMEVWRQNLVRMLATIRARGLRHGDLKGSNIITRGDWPWAIDWQEAHLIEDVPPQKQPWSDSYLLMQHIEGTPGPDGQFDTPRVARRWRAVLGSLGAIRDFNLPLKGKRFLDLGCFQGDFVAMAASEGMWALGIDRGGFRTGEDSIERGRKLWEGFPFGKVQLEHMDITVAKFEADVTIMFSTWPYILRDFGWQQAGAVLAQTIRYSGVLFFETQLAGDGPGPSFLETDSDVAQMLLELGARHVESIGTFTVTGRPAKRTVWRVER